MRFNGVVLQKLNALDTVLRELRSLVPLSLDDLNNDWRVRRAVERDLSNLEPYRPMIHFRNHLVHRYDIIDPAVLVGLVNDHLDDFDRFRSEVLAYAT